MIPRRRVIADLTLGAHSVLKSLHHIKGSVLNGG
jgi:hypothetical protein